MSKGGAFSEKQYFQLIQWAFLELIQMAQRSPNKFKNCSGPRSRHDPDGHIGQRGRLEVP